MKAKEKFETIVKYGELEDLEIRDYERYYDEEDGTDYDQAKENQDLIGLWYSYNGRRYLLDVDNILSAYTRDPILTGNLSG